GRSCRILSGDKDLMQLVTESTQILKPESGASTWKITGIEGVKMEWGVEPAQLLDLLALYGDTADNIPGVTGVGVKTAAKLLGDYKNLDGIYANIDQVKGAMQKKLIDGKDNAYFSQKLVRLCDQVPCDLIDPAINSDLYQYNFKAAADLLKGYEAFALAKSYAELGLGGESLPLAVRVSEGNSVVSESERTTPSNGANEIPDLPRNTPNLLEVKENDTSNYKALTKLDDLKAYIDQAIKAGLVAYDSECDSLDTLSAKLIGFSLCYEKGKAVYIPIQQQSEDLFNQTEYIEEKDALEQLIRLFTDSKVKIIMHNAKFDLKLLLARWKKLSKAQDFDFNLLNLNLSDTMIIAWLLNPEHLGKNGYSLEYLGETMLGLKGIEFKDIVSKGQTFADIPLENAYKYAAEDADFTYQLYLKLQEKWEEECKVHDKEQMQKLLEMEMKVLPILTKMELIGIHLDSDNLNAYSLELAKGIEEAEKNIYKEVGHEFNIASPKQLQTVLFEERGLKPGKKTKTGYSTDTSVLEELAYLDPVPKMILEYREMAKLKSTYVETLPKLVDEEGRIHTDFVQTGTATGRLSCREPNLQNIPVRSEAGRRIRGAFTAPEGKVLISADYAQIELVVLAHLSGDQNMCKAFIDGTDVHKSTAALIYGVSPDQVTPDMRRIAKTINFGVIYGMSAFSLAKDLGISRTQAMNFIDMYFHTYSSVSSFMSNVISQAEEKGYVQTLSGRRRPMLNINSRNKIEKSAAERIAKNTPIQGSAADIVKMAMLSVSQALKDSASPAKLLLQVHDELIFECPDDQATIDQTIALIRDKMENAVKLSVPLRVSVEYGKNWGEFH
nr:DNA polymerase I [Treponema sp.]